MSESFILDHVFMNNVEKNVKLHFKSGNNHYNILNMFNTLFGSLSNQNIEYQQITSAKYTVQMLRVHQNEGKKAFGRSPPYRE